MIGQGTDDGAAGVLAGPFVDAVRTGGIGELNDFGGGVEHLAGVAGEA